MTQLNFICSECGRPLVNVSKALSRNRDITIVVYPCTYCKDEKDRESKKKLTKGRRQE